MEPSSESNLFDLIIDHESSSYLGDTARWAKFLSILGFIFIGLMVIMAFSIGVIMSKFTSQLNDSSAVASALPSAIFTFIFLVFAVLYFFPTLFLYRFATRMQMAIRNNDQPQLIGSFRSLKSCFRFIGILTIIVLGLYVLLIFFNLFGTFTR
jgi:hypothetical protein